MNRDVKSVAEKPAVAPSSEVRRWSSVVALVPGVALCALGATVALIAGQFTSAVSPLLIAIVAGAVLANTVSLPAKFQPGLAFSAKRLLRVGIALLGLQLMFSDIVGLGWGVIAVVVAIVFLGIAGTMYAGKLLGLSWSQRILIACGFSICGAAAVAAADGVVNAREEELLTAVALVVIFGTLMIPTIPLLADAFGMNEIEAGMWAGGSIHEVAQVVAAGSALGATALGVATVVKLARVLMLAPVMAFLSIRQRTMVDNTATKRPPLIPLFVVAFIGCMGLRSTGMLPNELLGLAKTVQTALLAAAMFALGLGVRLSVIRGVGARPFVLAAISTVWVATIAYVGVVLVS
ncbi:putative sulfate exporter family transporter [Rhodococcus erythropolis]|uniref:YeiH family protein n=1 Tax=Rhodococcus erythropolis TaxID=1833 RepID=UPI0009C0B695|nr:putative sulfate exporter family transporter [Rhodococcus erythropolis]MBO8148967.1 putative sulfate exporter family transporter [Rhodococcus erythropolis]MBS2991815.1 putative sulfate exporter family transporter [Rhodococcus erythropolis]MDO1491050.1 putative sulfate exporter family transporter [Rhodococcus erythropolis]